MPSDLKVEQIENIFTANGATAVCTQINPDYGQVVQTVVGRWPKLTASRQSDVYVQLCEKRVIEELTGDAPDLDDDLAFNLGGG